ncbi:MAG TPA: bifunctional 5,10-methylene-tetrahydrofolate dehydrogenase/5,10-methylene-tetrahydrofolate cyclohydrolase [Firmicutes bacterium]|nr:bifunctional 5,10-methylene-tetrahydrofolate dehydrogenase/5,10-methylene-tetrahydrofolate cyclohydrolase [Bacillota bacterium]
MAAKLIKGDEVAAHLREKITAEIKDLNKATGLIPCLAVILAGEDHASLSYVRNLEKRSGLLGLNVQIHRLPVDVTEGELIRLIAELNDDDRIHGIIVQLPLPAHIDSHAVLETIDPDKDVDGAHPINMGKLFGDVKGYIPSTANSIMQMIEYTREPLYGKTAVLIGRSNIVGKPLSLLMLRRDASLTICHSYTQNLEVICREADILVAAKGKPGFVKADWIKPGAIVIDAGVTQIKGKPVGDIDFAAVKSVAGWISPVPPGVGPIITTMLQWSTLEAFKKIIAE